MSFTEHSDAIIESTSYFESDLPPSATIQSTGPVLLFADDHALRERCRQIVSAAGYLVTGNRGLEDAVAALSRQRHVTAVIACLASLDPESLGRFRQIENSCHEQQLPLLLVAEHRIYQALASSSLGLSCDYILFDPDAHDNIQLIAELNTALQLRAGEKADADGPDLQKISADVERIARTLNRLGEDRDDSADDKLFFPAASQEKADNRAAVAITARQVRDLIRARRLRDRFFDADLFADPAWDMLLDLLAARLEETDVSVSSLCIAAHVPPTTALRWIKAMTEKGIFLRRADARDGRRIFIELSDKATASMLRYLELLREERLMLA